MDEKFDEAEFWLPSEFLTDEDIIMDHKRSNSPGLLRFPAAFPYDYGSSALSSPVESLVGSTETESSDEEDFQLSALTSRLSLHDAPKFIPTQPYQEQKEKLLSGSPQSTLTKVGSWSGRSSGSSDGSPYGPSQVSSPPTTPVRVENDPWDLIFQASDQIAKLKISGAENPPRNPGILGPPKRLPTPPPIHNTSYFFEPQEMRQQDARGMWSREVNSGWKVDSHEILQNISGRVGVGIGGNGMGPSPCVWSSQQRNPQLGDFGLKGRAFTGAGYGYGFGYGTGSGVGSISGGLKRERSGTGVFLPRRYENSNYNSKASEYRKKTGSPAVLSNNPAHTLNQNFHMLNAYVQPMTKFTNDSVSLGDYEASLAMRNALLAKQRRSLCPETSSMSQEICLPQEWTY